MGGMSTRNEIKERLGLLAEPKATASRPGAKAAMGKPTDALMAVIEKRKRQMLDDLAESFRGPVQATTIKPLVSPIEQAQSLIQKGDVDGAMRLLNAWAQDLMGKYRSDPQMKMVAYTANALAKSAREAIQDMKQARASRPGAKAVMAIGEIHRIAPSESAIAQVRAIVNRILVREPSHPDLKSWKALEDALRKTDADAAIRAMYANRGAIIDHVPNEIQLWALKQARSFSRPGAKSRHAVREGEKVSASDDAVSRKIRKLMDEGKPQKQAIAIALDMKRRGEI